MAKHLQIFILSILFIGISNTSFATHNRAGEITYTQTGNLSIEATITTYTKASSTAADRDTLTICWGDGNCQQVARSNGAGTLLPNDTKVNLYTATHEYPAFGHFIVSMNDPNRNQGICNVNPPSSDSVPFHIQTTVTLLNQSLQGPNNSPVLLQPPIDIGCVGQKFVHNPNAYDIDGDSLSFEMIVPLQDIDQNAANYSWPNQIAPGVLNAYSLNPTTGVFTWMSPQEACEYNIAFYIISYRDGVPLDTMIRDMQILILECENEPPVIETIDEICVIAGETVTFDVVATAPTSDSDQLVTLTALGGPFEVDNPATFSDANTFQQQPLTRTFSWDTKCEHIADQYYSVVFRTTDNFPIIVNSQSGVDTAYLSTLKTVRIKVVGPPPEDVQALAGTGQVEVSWENPYSCETAEDYFQGFTVWRRQGSNLFPLDTCETGLDGKGYTKLTNFPIQDIVDGRYYYLDTDVERGRTYCYRILGEFARQTDVSPPPSLYNEVQSLASEEFCVQLSRDIPLITNVSVLTTNPAAGEIKVLWTKPIAEDLDTLLNPGPYVYEVLRATGFTGETFAPIGVSFSSNSFAEANDTCFTDIGLDTEGTPYSYQIAFYVNNEDEPIGTANGASSPWLSVASTDEINNLSWEADVPWENYQHFVFIYNNNTMNWDSLAMTTEPSYSHTGLFNGIEYCYRVQTVGSYGIEGLQDSLLNFSQENCGIPLDTIPPCPPTLEVTDDCEDLFASAQEEAFLNSLDWVNPMNICEETDDVVSYNIYFTPIEGGDFQLIDSITSSLITDLDHKPDLGIAGCYAVTALDTFYNESAFSNIVCIDNCPVYNLPNVFTPNGDGANEFFIPFPYRFVDHIDLQIFNRWGQLVHENTNPDIGWDGKDLSGNDLTEGTYFYVCRVFETRLNGVQQQPDILNGYIELIRGN